MCEIICYEDMTREEQLDYISERDGYIEDRKGYLSEGSELRCDCCGIAMHVKPARITSYKMTLNVTWDDGTTEDINASDVSSKEIEWFLDGIEQERNDNGE